MIGIVALSSTHLKADGSQIIVQSCSGSNVVKHEFTGIRQRTFKPTELYVQQVVARQFATRFSTFIANKKANTRGGNKILCVVI